MEVLTFETANALFVAFVTGLAGFLILRSFWRRPATFAVGRFALMPLLAGLVLLFVPWVLFMDDSVATVPLLFESTTLIGLGFVALLLGLIVGDMVLFRMTPVATSALEWLSRSGRRSTEDPRWPGVVAMAIVLGTTTAVLVAAGAVASDQASTDVLSGDQGSGFEVAAVHSLPTGPLSMVFRSGSDGYLALDNGQVVHFVLPDGDDGDLSLETATDSIPFPRGLTIADNTLFVSALGPTADRSTDGYVAAFDIQPDGTLTNERRVVSDLPVASRLHGVNGLTLGTDGLIYLSIGGTRLIASDEPGFALIGKVVRFAPDGSDLEVFAEGLRNVFDLTWDDEGRLFGVDNDGPTNRGFRREEIIEIKQGAHYGYPEEGTFDPPEVRTEPPFWVLDGTEGSAGVEWAPRAGLGPGLLIGSRRLLEYVPFERDEHGYYVGGEADLVPGATVELLRTEHGFLSVVEAGPDGLLYVGVFGSRLPSSLFVLTPSG